MWRRSRRPPGVPRRCATAPPFGVSAAAADVDFAKVREHVRRVAAALAPNESVARLTGLGIRVIEGEARFKDRRTLVAAGAFEIRARRFVIATGSAPALPSIPGLEQGPYSTSDSIFTLDELPQPPHRHRRRIDRPRTGAELSPARQRGDRARGRATALLRG